jgi:hypothetical protein
MCTSQQPTPYLGMDISRNASLHTGYLSEVREPRSVTILIPTFPITGHDTELDGQAVQVSFLPAS